MEASMELIKVNHEISPYILDKIAIDSGNDTCS